MFSFKHLLSRSKRAEERLRKTEEVLSELLRDHFFVDYFNVFLNLPVFGVRVLIKRHDKNFLCDPPIFEAVNPDKMVAWMAANRFPLFKKTDLFLEYRLCHKLRDIDFEFGFRDRVTVPDCDRWTGRILQVFANNLLGSVAGMYLFREHLRDTAGANVYGCWLHVQRFRQTRNPAKRREMFREIQQRYLHATAVHKLSNRLCTVMLLDLLNFPMLPASETELAARLTSGRYVSFCEVDLSSRDALIQVHRVLLDALRAYWVPRYVMHVLATQPLSVLKELLSIRGEGVLLNAEELKTLITTCAIYCVPRDPRTKTKFGDDQITIDEKSLPTVSPSSSSVSSISSSHALVPRVVETGSLTDVPPPKSPTDLHLHPQHPCFPPLSPEGQPVEPPLIAYGQTSHGVGQDHLAAEEKTEREPGQPQSYAPEEDLQDICGTGGLTDTEHDSDHSVSDDNDKDKEKKTSSDGNMADIHASKGDNIGQAPTGDNATAPSHDDRQDGNEKNVWNAASILNFTRLALKEMVLQPEPMIYIGQLLQHYLFGYRHMDRERPVTDRRTLCLLACDELAGSPFRSYLRSREQQLHLSYFDFWSAMLRYQRLHDLERISYEMETECAPTIATLRRQNIRHVADRFLMGSGLETNILDYNIRLNLLQDMTEGRWSPLINSTLDVVSNVLSIPMTQYILHDRRNFRQQVLELSSPQLLRRNSHEPEEIKSGLPMRIPSALNSLVMRRSEAITLRTFADRRSLSDPWRDDPHQDPEGDMESMSSADPDGTQHQGVGVLGEQHRLLAFQFLIILRESTNDVQAARLCEVGSLAKTLHSDYGSLHIPVSPPVRDKFLASIRQKERKAFSASPTRSLTAVEGGSPKPLIPAVQRLGRVGVLTMQKLVKLRKKRNKIGLVRPPTPRTFFDVLADEKQFRSFKNYLKQKGQEEPLLFCEAVQDAWRLKEPEDRAKLAAAIVERFFANGGQRLNTSRDVILTVIGMEEPDLPTLSTVQYVLEKQIEETWFQKYVQDLHRSDRRFATQSADKEDWIQEYIAKAGKQKIEKMREESEKAEKKKIEKMRGESEKTEKKKIEKMRGKSKKAEKKIIEEMRGESEKTEKKKIEMRGKSKKAYKMKITKEREALLEDEETAKSGEREALLEDEEKAKSEEREALLEDEEMFKLEESGSFIDEEEEADGEDENDHEDGSEALSKSGTPRKTKLLTKKERMRKTTLSGEQRKDKKTITPGSKKEMARKTTVTSKDNAEERARSLSLPKHEMAKAHERESETQGDEEEKMSDEFEQSLDLHSPGGEEVNETVSTSPDRGEAEEPSKKKKIRKPSVQVKEVGKEVRHHYVSQRRGKQSVDGKHEILDEESFEVEDSSEEEEASESDEKVEEKARQQSVSEKKDTQVSERKAKIVHAEVLAVEGTGKKDEHKRTENKIVHAEVLAVEGTGKKDEHKRTENKLVKPAGMDGEEYEEEEMSEEESFQSDSSTSSTEEKTTRAGKRLTFLSQGKDEDHKKLSAVPTIKDMTGKEKMEEEETSESKGDHKEKRKSFGTETDYDLDSEALKNTFWSKKRQRPPVKVKKRKAAFGKRRDSRTEQGDLEETSSEIEDSEDESDSESGDDEKSEEEIDAGVSEAKKEAEETLASQLMNLYIRAKKYKRRVQWTNVLRWIRRFLRSMNNPFQRHLFELFLKQELVQSKANNDSSFKYTDVEEVERTVYTRLMPNKDLIKVNSLPADLRFWWEAHRFKDQILCHLKSKKKIKRVDDDNPMLAMRANAIMECYFKSVFEPLVQVNFCRDKTALKMKSDLQKHGVTGDLFHDIYIQILPVLFRMWREFSRTWLSKILGLKRERVLAEMLAMYRDPFIGDLPHPAIPSPDYLHLTFSDFQYFAVTEKELYGFGSLLNFTICNGVRILYIQATIQISKNKGSKNKNNKTTSSKLLEIQEKKEVSQMNVQKDKNWNKPEIDDSEMTALVESERALTRSFRYGDIWKFSPWLETEERSYSKLDIIQGVCEEQRADNNRLAQCRQRFASTADKDTKKRPQSKQKERREIAPWVGPNERRCKSAVIQNQTCCERPNPVGIGEGERRRRGGEEKEGKGGERKKERMARGGRGGGIQKEELCSEFNGRKKQVSQVDSKETKRVSTSVGRERLEEEMRSKEHFGSLMSNRRKRLKTPAGSKVIEGISSSEWKESREGKISNEREGSTLQEAKRLEAWVDCKENERCSTSKQILKELGTSANSEENNACSMSQNGQGLEILAGSEEKTGDTKSQEVLASGALADSEENEGSSTSKGEDTFKEKVTSKDVEKVSILNSRITLKTKVHSNENNVKVRNQCSRSNERKSLKRQKGSEEKKQKKMNEVPLSKGDGYPRGDKGRKMRTEETSKKAIQETEAKKFQARVKEAWSKSRNKRDETRRQQDGPERSVCGQEVTKLVSEDSGSLLAGSRQPRQREQKMQAEDRTVRPSRLADSQFGILELLSPVYLTRCLPMLDGCLQLRDQQCVWAAGKPICKDDCAEQVSRLVAYFYETRRESLGLLECDDGGSGQCSRQQQDLYNARQGEVRRRGQPPVAIPRRGSAVGGDRKNLTGLKSFSYRPLSVMLQC